MFGRRFGTKLGGVSDWLWQGLKAAAWSSAVAAAAGAEECISRFFSRDSEVTLGSLAVHFWTSFQHEMRLCFGLAKGCARG